MSDILEFIDDYTAADGHAEELTHGRCYEFAKRLENEFPGGKILSDGDHVVYRYEGRDYDGDGIAKASTFTNGYLPIEMEPEHWKERGL